MPTLFRFPFRRSLLAGLLTVTVVLAGCAGSDEAGDAGDDAAAPAETATTQRSVRVETMMAAPTAFEDVVELTGAVEALNDATLSAQSAGTVVSLAPLGAVVSAGRAVAQLDPGVARASVAQAQAAVNSAQAQLDLAEDNFRRQEPLYRDSVISAIEFENVRAQLNQARAGVEQAKAQLAQAGEQLRYTQVVAPFTGVVEERFVEQGEQVSPGARIARVVSTGRVEVTAGVPERYAGDVEVGTPVRVSFGSYGIAPRTGRVTFAGSVISPASRTFPIEIELDNTDGRLKPEMVARVQVTREQLDDVVVVPTTAVLRDENGTSLFVAAERDGALVATRRPVTLGSSFGGRTVVTSGLEPGERVLVVGQTNVTEGNLLEVTEEYEGTDAAVRALGLASPTPAAP